MTVHFIGAGPGAPDLITVRGLKRIQSCPVCLYAGSLVPEEIVKAMEPFGQVESALSRKHQGTGLGLPLTKALAELHGATFEVFSQKDHGTTVRVTMPKHRTIPRPFSLMKEDDSTTPIEHLGGLDAALARAQKSKT